MQVDAGLEALGESLNAGFEQFNKVRTDPNLESLRKSPKFKTLIDSYDEPVFNDNAIKYAPGSLPCIRLHVLSEMSQDACMVQHPCCRQAMR